MPAVSEFCGGLLLRLIGVPSKFNYLSSEIFDEV